MSIGYARAGRPNTPTGKRATVFNLIDFKAEWEVDQVMREQDPFGLAHACISPGGHQPISLGDAMVCFHCSRIFTP